MDPREAMGVSGSGHSNSPSESNQGDGGFVSQEIGESSRPRQRTRTRVSDDANSYQFRHELLMKIALGLPVKSLLRFLCVSKQWESTIRSKDFRAAYFTKSLIRQGSLLFTFACEDYNFVFASPPLDDNASSSTEVASYHFTYSMESFEPITPSVHGLFCYGPHSGITIYNPCTRQSVFLPGIITSIRSSRKIVNCYVGYAVGIGYKVLCVMSGIPPFGAQHAAAQEIWVLTLGNDENYSWRMVQNFPPHARTSYEMCIDGILYYGAFIGPDLTQAVIMSFDVSSESFQLISVPEEAAEFPSCFNLLRSSRLTSYKGKLAVLFYEHHGGSTVNLWVLDDAVWEEWSKETFELPSLVGLTADLNLQLCSATNAGEVILAPGFVRASTYPIVYYDPTEGSFRKIEIEGITEQAVPDEVQRWWYCHPVSVFPGQVENLMFLKPRSS